MQGFGEFRVGEERRAGASKRSSVCKSEKIAQEAVSRAQGRGEEMGRDDTGAAARPVFSTKWGRVQLPSSETIRRELMQSQGLPSV